MSTEEGRKLAAQIKALEESIHGLRNQVQVLFGHVGAMRFMLPEVDTEQ